MAVETRSSSMPNFRHDEQNRVDVIPSFNPDGHDFGTSVSVLESKIAELWEELDNLKEKGQLTEGKTQSLGVTIDKVKEKLDKIKEELHKLDKDYEMLKQKVTDLEKKLGQKVTDLEKKLGQFQQDSDKLYLGQTASVYEQALCSHVLPEVFQKDKFASIKQLTRYLSEEILLPKPFRTEKAAILSDAKKRWDELCEKMEFPAEWKTKSGLREIENDDLQAIAILKQERVPVAHPKSISLARATEIVLSNSYKESLPQWQYDFVMRFICSVPEKLHKGNLKHKNIIVGE